MTKYFEIKSEHYYPVLVTNMLTYFRIIFLLIISIPLIFLILPIYFIFKEYYLNYEIKIVKEIMYEIEIDNFLLIYLHKIRDTKKNINIKDIIEIENTKISKRHYLSHLCRVQSIFIYTKFETYVIFYNNNQIKELDEIYNDLVLMLEKIKIIN